MMFKIMPMHGGRVMAADTRERIMKAARLTVQALGYSGLSFRELAKDVGIKSASIHYYFATKAELGAALARDYTDFYAVYLDSLLSQGLDTAACLSRYTDMFADTLRLDNRMCLAGILSAERNELPEEIRTEVMKFGEMNERWLAGVLAHGNTGAPAQQHRARAIFSAVSGAQLIAHSRGDVSVYDDIIAAYRTSGLIP